MLAAAEKLRHCPRYDLTKRMFVCVIRSHESLDERVAWQDVAGNHDDHRKSINAAIEVKAVTSLPRILEGRPTTYLAAGAQGFIPKSASLAEISEGLEAVLEGDLWTPKGAALVAPNPGIKALATLSPAQARILAYLRRGLLNKQIAYELGVTEATVKAHMTGAFKKLGVVNRTQALIMLAQASPTPPEAASAG